MLWKQNMILQDSILVTRIQASIDGLFKSMGGAAILLKDK
jgi:hypothetical protein